MKSLASGSNVAVRPGSTRAEVEERARSFYPRLSEELLQEAVSIVSGEPPPHPAPPEASVEEVPDGAEAGAEAAADPVATARAIPGSRLLVFPEMGHDLPRGRRAEIAEAITQNARRA